MESTDKGKNVVIDLTNYGNINVGFGQIAANYAKRFAESNHDDFQLTYLVPEKCDVDFGSDIKKMCIRDSIFPGKGIHPVNRG